MQDNQGDRIGRFFAFWALLGITLGGFVISPKILNYFFHIFCSTEIMALEFA
jgi:nitric oxide reductase large subunit